MICSNVKNCDSLECNHKKPHEKERKCFNAPCSRFNGENIPCKIHDIKYIRKEKILHLNQNLLDQNI